MEIRYEMTIKSSKETIEFKTTETQNTGITGVTFGFDSKNELKDRDKDGKVIINVYGAFNGEQDTLNAIKQLSDWAKSREDVYREVTIILSTDYNSSDIGNFRRTYHFDRMYCVDYFENAGTAITKEERAGEGIEFVLLMAQSPTYKVSETKVEKI